MCITNLDVKGTNTLSHKKLTALIAVLFLTFFCFFLLLYERHIHKEAQSNIEKHALIIADALWNFNSQGASKYLSLACESSHYKHLVVTDTEGAIFLELTDKKSAGIEKICTSLHFIPEIPLISNVMHAGKKIGQVKVIWYCDALYTEIYVLFALIMLYLIFDLNTRLLYAKNLLELRVRERTEELTNSNILLQQKITEHRQAEEEKRESEERFKNLTSLLPLPVWETNLEGNFTYVNQSAHETFGYTLEDVAKGVTMTTVIAPEDRERIVENFRKKLCGIEFADHEYTCITKEGRKFPSLIYSSPIIKNDKPSGVRGVTLDISKRVQAEQLLRERELKLRNILQGAPTGIGIVIDQVFVEVNQQFCKMVGYTEPELLGHNSSIVYPSDEEHEWVVRERMKHVRKHGMGTFESHLRQKNGKIINMLVSWKPLNENDLSAGIIFNALDITEMKKLEGQLSQSRKMESIGTLAGGIAHDFNNVLTAISGYAQMVEIKLEEGSKLRDDIKQIQKASDRAAALTRQLLGFSRKQIIIPRTIHINKLIGNMSKMLGRLINEDIRLETSLDEQVGSIYADPSQVEQVIMNLVVNARDAVNGQFGKAEKTIKISSSQVFLDQDFVAIHEGSRTGWYLRLGVEDSGCGMSKEILERIFEPFYTTKGVGKGTGMGLATVYGIVKQNNGSIYVTSEPGQGTTFQIYWPISAAESTETVVEGPELSRGGSEVILLAEDDDQIRKISCRQLREAGYTVIEAENGLKALEVAIKHQGKVDLLFTDVVMPLMGGKELSEKIKKIYPEITTIYTSGHMDETIQQDIVDFDQDHFINKPYRINDIMIRIRRLFDNLEGHRSH